MTDKRNKKNWYNNQQQNTIEQINAQYGKLPPQAIEVEEAVLGTLMLERDAIFKVLSIISVNAFYKEEHQKIFHIIQELSETESPIDLLQVTQRLKDRGILDEVGGPGYITKLTRSVASAAHIEFHARIIAQKYIQRELIRVSSEIQTVSYDDTIDIDDLIERWKSLTTEIDELITGHTRMMHISNIVDLTVQNVEEGHAKAARGETPGIATGFADLDRFTAGWQPGDSIIIAGRPSMGKTALALQLAKRTAQRGNHVNMFELEMTNIRLSTRMILSNGGIDVDRLKNRNMNDGDWAAFNQSASELKKLPIWIDDTGRQNTKRIDAIVRTKARKGECDLGIIDYLQLAEYGNHLNKNSNREQEVAGISRDIKLTAKAANVPFIVLSQLNRAIENREDKRPKLADLRESGAIEQDADIVIMIWRPEYYGILEDDSGNSLKNLIFLEVVKNREGKLGTIILSHNEEMTEFYDFNNRGYEIPEGTTNDTPY